jgi:hypothetical protein
LLLAVIAVITRKQSGLDVVYWSILTFGFLYLAVDEAVSIHELANSPLRSVISNGEPSILHYAWVIPAAVAIVLFGLLFAGFLRRLPFKTRTAFVIAAIMYVGGGLGVELLEGRYGDWQPDSVALNALVVLEETLEMFGVIVFIWALLVYITVNFRHVGFRFLPLAGRAVPKRP